MYQAIINAVGVPQNPGSASFPEASQSHSIDQVLGTAIDSLRMLNPAAADRVWQSEFAGAEVADFGRQSGKSAEAVPAMGEEPLEEEGPSKKKVSLVPRT